MDNNFIQLDNENSVDRAPDDTISPDVDASINIFEKNPDDSVDITAEYDDDKAQIIEVELQNTNQEQ